MIHPLVCNLFRYRTMTMLVCTAACCACLASICTAHACACLGNAEEGVARERHVADEHLDQERLRCAVVGKRGAGGVRQLRQGDGLQPV